MAIPQPRYLGCYNFERMTRIKQSHPKRQWVSGAIAAVLALVFGLVLLELHLGDLAKRVSYDLLFALRADLPANDVALIYVDEKSHGELHQPLGATWDRSLHARLVDRLTAAGAKAIVFDILFTEASSNSVADAAFEQAIRRSGKVILGGNYHEQEKASEGLVAARWEEKPYEPFRAAAAAWGNVNFHHDSDYGVRSFFPNVVEVAGEREIRWLPEAVANFVSPSQVKPWPQDRERWFNFVGPPGTLPYVPFYQALRLDEISDGFFKNKIVFVGGKLTADFSGKAKDDFRTPYAYAGKAWAPGVDFHATATLNLFHQNWLTSVPQGVQGILVLIAGIAGGFGLMRLQPLLATLMASLGVAVIVVAAFFFSWRYLTWFAWLIPVFQIGIALFGSVIANSLQLYVERRLLEQSLSVHMSPKLVKRLLNEPALRQLGGAQQEISILFTDVANFSRISETVHSDDLVRLMNKYFDTALRCIHETDGTIIKLLGDSIFAVWNAPIAQPDHRERACMTALHLREKIVQFDVAHLSLPLRTRVGVHAGMASVGNIGSSLHFDYTALGDNINLTSRLEGLNKFLGTSVLVTREVQRALEKEMIWRPVGHFQFKGLGRIAEVIELVGSPERAESTRGYREQFAAALHEFRLRKFDSAAEKFEKTIQLRRIVEPEYTAGTAVATSDGPSRFYLDKIEEFRIHPPPRDWLGEIELKEK